MSKSSEQFRERQYWGFVLQGPFYERNREVSRNEFFRRHPGFARQVIRGVLDNIPMVFEVLP